MKGKFDKGNFEPSNRSVKEYGGTDPNYNKNKQKMPEHPMGHGSYSNLPSGVIFKNFSRSHDYRGGVPNGFTCGLEEESGIDENRP